MYRSNIDEDSNNKTSIQILNEQRDLKIFQFKEAERNRILELINKEAKSIIDNLENFDLRKPPICVCGINFLTISEVKKFLNKNGLKYKINYFNWAMFKICKTDSMLKKIIHTFKEIFGSQSGYLSDGEFEKLNYKRVLVKVYW